MDFELQASLFGNESNVLPIRESAPKSSNWNTASSPSIMRATLLLNKRLEGGGLHENIATGFLNRQCCAWVGFSETIRKTKARTSLLTRFRPPTWLTLETQVQYKRNPARCQFTTVLGVTKMRGLVHPDQNVLNATQNSLCRAVNRRRGCCACRASNCRRRARFSRTRSSREWKALTNKCRSDTIMARIVAEKSESSLFASHSFCGCTTFWRGTLPAKFSRRGR
jgi:hypothetical protein